MDGPSFPTPNGSQKPATHDKAGMNGSDATQDIRILREPTVYLVGRQVVAQEEIDRFLADHGVSWQTDTEVAGEFLAEAAGRICYMSFAKPRPGGNKAYLDHILDVGHGSVLEHAVWNFVFCGVSRSLTHELIRHRHFGYCLTGDTLVYSELYNHRQKKLDGNPKRRGPRKHRLDRLYEYTKTPRGRAALKRLRLRCLDESTGSFTQGRICQIVSSGVKPVFQVELEGGKSITCSKEHRFLTPSGWKSIAEVVGGLDVSAGRLACYGNLETPIATNGILAYQDRAWLQSHYVDEGMEQGEIAELSGVSKHTIRAWIRKHGLQKPLGSWTIGREPWNKDRHYQVGWKHSPETKRLLREQKLGKNNPQWRGGSTPFSSQIRRGVTELAPSIFARDAYSCRLCQHRGGELQVHHVIPIWARPDLALIVENLATVCKQCHKKVSNGHELEYAEKFGVPPTEVEALAGNSPRRAIKRLVPRFRKICSIRYAGPQETFDLEMEAPHHNFVANGIVTHNSQLSQRYVDESVAEYVEPDAIADDPEAHQIWLDAIAHSHQAYVNLVQKLQEHFKDEPDKTLRRKLARQAARSVLPNATETKIFVTGNARALRHFIEMRGSRHAETEIRKLAVQVLKLLRQEAPHLFSDYQLIPLPDGTEEAVTEHRKV